MKVTVKDLSAEIELKNSGMELNVHDTDGTFLGDLAITKTSVIWCNGKTKRENGIKVGLKDFIDLMNAHAAKKTAKAPAKKVKPKAK